MKHTATAEQKAAASERRAKLRTLAKTISGMSPAERVEMTATTSGGIPTCEGHLLSIFNTCLLISQYPAVSVVGGFRQWNRVGRKVSKGAHGLSIWISLARAQDPNQQEGEITSCDLEGPHFTVATVFDISATEPVEPEE